MIQNSPRPPLTSSSTEADIEIESAVTPWREALGLLGAEIAMPLTAALERVNALVASDTIERPALRALREEIESARQAGMIGQQLARFGGGRLRQSHERLHLDKTLRGVLTHRARETQRRGIALTQVFVESAVVIVDASLLFSLCNHLLDWALLNARSSIEFRIDETSWPRRARLRCQFLHRPPDEVPGAAGGNPRAARVSAPDSMVWRLIRQIAESMELIVDRVDSPTSSCLVIEFPRTVGTERPAEDLAEHNEGFAPSTNSKPLAGSQILVISNRRDVRNQIRQAISNMGLLIDFVHDIDGAVEFCRDGLPHAIVLDGMLHDHRFQALRANILADVPQLAFIEIDDATKVASISSFGVPGIARIGRNAIGVKLPSALMFELSKAL